MSNFDHIRPYVANDNSPPIKTPRGDAVGFNAMLRERQLHRQASQLNLESSDKFEDTFPIGFWISLIFWLGFAGAAIWSFYTSQPIGTRIFTAFGLIWTGLWSRFLALDHQRPRLAEVCLLSTLIGFLGLLVTATVQMGYPLNLPAGLMVFIGAALLVSIINNSLTALICAIAGSLFWAALQIDGYMETTIYSFGIPAILALIVFQGLRLKSGVSVFVAAVIGYIWLGGTSILAFNNGHLSALMLASGAAVIGSAHYRSAKAAEDEGLSFTGWQTGFGWVVANGALLVLAKYGLDPLDPIWHSSRNTTPVMRLSWLGVVGVGVLIYFTSSFIRSRHGRMSLAGVALTTVLLTCLPFGVWYLTSLETYVADLTGLPFYPNAGLFLFGVITGNIIFFISNAFRRHHYLKVIIALLAIAALAYSASTIDLIHQENWVTWLIGTLISLVIALIAVEPQLASNEDAALRTSVSSS